MTGVRRLRPPRDRDLDAFDDNTVLAAPALGRPSPRPCSGRAKATRLFGPGGPPETLSSDMDPPHVRALGPARRRRRLAPALWLLSGVRRVE